MLLFLFMWKLNIVFSIDSCRNICLQLLLHSLWYTGEEFKQKSCSLSWPFLALEKFYTWERKIDTNPIIFLSLSVNVSDGYNFPCVCLGETLFPKRVMNFNQSRHTLRWCLLKWIVTYRKTYGLNTRAEIQSVVLLEMWQGRAPTRVPTGSLNPPYSKRINVGFAHEILAWTSFPLH